MLRFLIFFIVLTSLFGCKAKLPPIMEGSLTVPKVMENTQISDKAGTILSLDKELLNHKNEKVLLSSFFDKEKSKPSIL